MLRVSSSHTVSHTLCVWRGVGGGGGGGWGRECARARVYVCVGGWGGGSTS